MVASWTIVFTIVGLDMDTTVAFKPDFRPNPIMTAKAAKSWKCVRL